MKDISTCKGKNRNNRKIVLFVPQLKFSMLHEINQQFFLYLLKYDFSDIYLNQNYLCLPIVHSNNRILFYKIFLGLKVLPYFRSSIIFLDIFYLQQRYLLVFFHIFLNCFHFIGNIFVFFILAFKILFISFFIFLVVWFFF